MKTPSNRIVTEARLEARLATICERSQQIADAHDRLALATGKRLADLETAVKDAKDQASAARRYAQTSHEEFDNATADLEKQLELETRARQSLQSRFNEFKNRGTILAEEKPLQRQDHASAQRLDCPKCHVFMAHAPKTKFVEEYHQCPQCLGIFYP